MCNLEQSKGVINHYLTLFFSFGDAPGIIQRGDALVWAHLLAIWSIATMQMALFHFPSFAGEHKFAQ